MQNISGTVRVIRVIIMVPGMHWVGPCRWPLGVDVGFQGIPVLVALDVPRASSDLGLRLLVGRSLV